MYLSSYFNKKVLNYTCNYQFENVTTLQLQITFKKKKLLLLNKNPNILEIYSAT